MVVFSRRLGGNSVLSRTKCEDTELATAPPVSSEINYAGGVGPKRKRKADGERDFELCRFGGEKRTSAFAFGPPGTAHLFERRAEAEDIARGFDGASHKHATSTNRATRRSRRIYRRGGECDGTGSGYGDGIVSEHMMKSFEEELARLESTVMMMGELTVAQLEAAIASTERPDSERAASVIQCEPEANRMMHEIDNLVIRVLALRQPMAIDLREVLSALRIAIELERICDHAEDLAERSIALRAAHFEPVHSLVNIGRFATKMVGDAMHAYTHRDDPRPSRSGPAMPSSMPSTPPSFASSSHICSRIHVGSRFPSRQEAACRAHP